MYLTECLLRNVGPIEALDISMPMNEDGTPQPIVLVDPNGSGKTVFLSHIVDALIEFAKLAYTDIVPGQQRFSAPYFKILGGTNQRAGSAFGIALLDFVQECRKFAYIDKTGNVDSSLLEVDLRNRFTAVKQRISETDSFKGISPQNKELLEEFFGTNAVCYFPSSRHERPHWLNQAGVVDKPVFHVERRIVGQLRRPIVVESAVQETTQWLLDVVLDSRADVDLLPKTWADTTGQVQNGYDAIIADNVQETLLLQQSRRNIDTLLAQVLGDSTARIVVNHRAAPHRLSIAGDKSGTIPSLDHLSAGQAVLFNTFATIVRYADRGDINKSIRLHDINGIVLIDEIEAHIHADFQYDLLPRLVKMFPRVQFIMTSHSPLFLLGMEREFGSSGFLILEMPTAETIGTERFSEFQTSFQYYRKTKAFEDEVRSALAVKDKPIVFTEGETDPNYITTALDLLGRGGLLAELEIRPVGRRTSAGTVGGGINGLNQIRAITENHPDFLKRNVLLLYDCDSNKPEEDIGLLSVRAIPKNTNNSKIRKGIENLLPPHVFEDRFYTTKETTGDYGEQNIKQNLDKTKLCEFLCEERRDSLDFEQFTVVIQILDEFLKRASTEAQGASFAVIDIAGNSE